MTEAYLEALGLTPEDLAGLREAVPQLHVWYRGNARDLPWRRTRDPYAIWVSEVMCQQTRVTAAIPYYQRWLAAVPSVATLAAADDRQVLVWWEGLGYYSRARNFHRAAQAVVRDHGGQVPTNPEAFRALPGVGPYTAAAVLSIAFGADLAAFDGNVRRVLARLAALNADPARAPQAGALLALAAALLPAGTAAVHNQAMMELGALTCTPRGPRCGACPLASCCRGLALGEPGAFPRLRAKAPVPHYQVVVGIAVDQGLVFLGRRPYGRLLGGLWEFPGGKVEPGETVERALARELREEFGLAAEIVGALEPVAHAYSHFRVTLHPRLCRFVARDPRVGEGREGEWVDSQDLGAFPMPRANRKILEQLAAWPDWAKAVPRPERRPP